MENFIFLCSVLELQKWSVVTMVTMAKWQQWSIASKDNFHVIFMGKKPLDIRIEKKFFLVLLNFAQINFRAHIDCA